MDAPTVTDVMNLMGQLNLGDRPVAAEAINRRFSGLQTGWVYMYRVPVRVQVRAGIAGQGPVAELYCVKIGKVNVGNSLRDRMVDEMNMFAHSRNGDVLAHPIPPDILLANVTDSELYNACVGPGGAANVCFFVETTDPTAVESRFLDVMGNFTSSPKKCPKAALVGSLATSFGGLVPVDATPAALWMNWLLQPVNFLSNSHTGKLGVKEWRIVTRAVFDGVRGVWNQPHNVYSFLRILSALPPPANIRFTGFVRLHRDVAAPGNGKPVAIKVWDAEPSATETDTGHTEAHRDAIGAPWL